MLARAKRGAIHLEYTIKRATDLSEIEHIYNSYMTRDFIPDELKPMISIRKAWERNAYEALLLLSEDIVLGYALFVRLDRDYLLDYFAIAEEYRNMGLGTVFLKQFSDFIHDADCIVAEIEDTERAEDEKDKETRHKRQLFYLRCGYRETGVKSKVFGVNYCILEAPSVREHSQTEIRSIYTALYQSILPETFFRSEFQII